MSEIHQIYCTHCTLGSSATERNSGELASRVMGYGARASSLPREKLPEYYAHLEPLIYYYLPPDTPRDKAMEATIDSSPRRLFYHPSVGGTHAVGQVCFRDKDTAGRPGSYFAHVLLGVQNDQNWSVLGCAKLWGADRWVEEDSAAHPHDLKPLSGLDVLHGESPPAVGDGVLRSFLITPCGGAFDDPQGLISRRWREVDVQKREDLLIDVLAAYLELRGSKSRKSVLLVVEPELAALLFYGVARLLPEGPIREEVSFSTFEPRPEAVSTALAATTFYAPRDSDLDASIYRGGGFVCNTFREQWWKHRPEHREYAGLVVGELKEGGWDAANALLSGFQAAKPGSVADLDVLARTHAVAKGVLNPESPLRREVWQSSAPAARYFRAWLDRQLVAASAAPEERLSAVLGQPRQWDLVQLTAGKPVPEKMKPAAEYLLFHLPESLFPKFLELWKRWQSKGITSDSMYAYLVNFVNDQKRFPKACEFLWKADEKEPDKLPSRQAASFFTEVLSQIKPDALNEFFSGLEEVQQGIVLAAIAEMWPNVPKPKTAPCAEGFVQIIEDLPKDRLVRFLHRYRKALPSCYPKDRPKLGKRLREMLDDLHNQADHFSEWLDVLDSWVEHCECDDINEVQDQIDSWGKARTAILKGPEEEGFFWQKWKARDDFAKELSNYVNKAVMNVERPLDHEDKSVRLRAIAGALLGKSSFLEDEAWRGRVDKWLKKRQGAGVSEIRF